MTVPRDQHDEMAWKLAGRLIQTRERDIAEALRQAAESARAKAFEEAAKLADGYSGVANLGSPANITGHRIALAIRALATAKKE